MSACGPVGSISHQESANECQPHNEAISVYWHRELPPLDADLVAEHTVEARSSRVPGTLCTPRRTLGLVLPGAYDQHERPSVEEVSRLGGHYAHVHAEVISPKHDDAAGEAWLHGSFHGDALHRGSTGNSVDRWLEGKVQELCGEDWTRGEAATEQPGLFVVYGDTPTLGDPITWSRYLRQPSDACRTQFAR